METKLLSTPGHRRLSAAEAEMIEKIRSTGEALDALIREVRTLNAKELRGMEHGGPERDEFVQANPERWAAMAQTDMQRGVMALVRAVAKPATF